jgi:hypothetical protein
LLISVAASESATVPGAGRTRLAAESLTCRTLIQAVTLVCLHNTKVRVSMDRAVFPRKRSVSVVYQPLLVAPLSRKTETRSSGRLAMASRVYSVVTGAPRCALSHSGLGAAQVPERTPENLTLGRSLAKMPV